MRALVLLLLLPVLVATPAVAGTTEPVPPPAGVPWDYQIGGVRAVPDEVGIVVRDRRAEPVPDRYNVCYVNGFQTQPDERRFWRGHWRLVLKKHGEPVVDGAWGEWLLDIGSPAKRRALARIVGRWTDRCAADGYDAVELDNLDSFSRSRGLLTRGDTRRFASRLVERAHDAGLAVAQKNRAQWNGTAVGFDFAVAEQCGRYRECGDYVATYGGLVLAVEYGRRPFRLACRGWGDRISVVRRDLAVSDDGIRRWCAS
ncbi:endo alpha-1,4 polygalactosaminidase [Nocardioides euryhalodurans]|uniref:Glycoside-hydrolase family GH114 TIM-barrel domain-containing protein n=1 Tax=Nocardioides euryhalodurans TaxID=2518370 RepID=A0A4P7GIC7_9ACTN|nr:endo alpha-1,4 polygalactosaminidase [Nocardioides euryhalodurans]QBR91700.1 hypothetical protein EXE57_05030 [Nocardioides euryhalodurans]